MLTVRARITALSTVVAAVVLVAAAFALVAILDQQVSEQSDGSLRARATELADLAVTGSLSPQPGTVTDEGLVQVIDQDGRVLAASANVRGAPPIGPPSQRPSDLAVLTMAAPDDNESEDYRVWRVSREGPTGVVTVYAGVSLEAAREATATLRASLTVGVPLLLLLLAAGTWWVVGGALGRVESVRREVAGIGDADLSRRLEPGSPDEVGRLVGTLNDMLSRLEDGQRRQRDFVADASHELQSPVTALRAQLEVAAAHPEAAEWTSLVDDLVEDIDRMQHLVSDLLLLAVSGSVAPRPARLDLRELVESELARPMGDRVEIDLAPGPSLPVRGDEAQLARVVRNLLDNGVRHAAARLVVRAEEDAGLVRVTFEDDGAGVPVEHLGRVFDRFHRVDAARSRAGRGTGLGLAIARSVACAHGGDVVLLGPGPGATFELLLPRAEGDGGRDGG